MSGDRICVAGIDPITRRHVRPVTSEWEPLTRTLLGTRGGPLRVGALIEVENPTERSIPPHTEDVHVSGSAFRLVRDLAWGEYMELLEAVRVRRLSDGFGVDFTRSPNGRLKLEQDSGSGSLCVVRKNTNKLSVRVIRNEKTAPRMPASKSLSPAAWPIFPLQT